MLEQLEVEVVTDRALVRGFKIWAISGCGSVRFNVVVLGVVQGFWVQK